MHGALHPLADKYNPVNDEKNSIATLPDGLEIKESFIPGAGLGIITTQKFESGTRFGPYQGKKVRPDIPRDDVDTSYMWEVINIPIKILSEKRKFMQVYTDVKNL